MVTLAVQVASKRYHPVFYWAVVVATTTVKATPTSHHLDRTLGLGYVKSSIMLFCAVVAVLVIWRSVTGRIRNPTTLALRQNQHLLLGDDPGVEHAGSTAAGRFCRQQHGAWFRARSAGVCGSDCAGCRGALLYQLAGLRALLGRLTS